MRELQEHDGLDRSAINRGAHNGPDGHVHGANCLHCQNDDAKLAAVYKVLVTRASNKRAQIAEVNTKRRDSKLLETTSANHPNALKIIGGLIFFVIVAAMLCLWLSDQNSAKMADQIDLQHRTLVTVGGARSLEFDHGRLTVTDRGVRTNVPKVRAWQDNWKDHLALIMGEGDNAVWIKSVPDGLETADGTIYYDTQAPELAVIETMRAIRDNALHSFQTRGRYPNDVPELLAGIKRFSIKPSNVSLTHTVGPNFVTAVGETSFERSLKGGQHFTQETNHQPNSISCLEVKSEPTVSADMNSYGWRTNAFFIQGYDRHGKLIGNPDDHTTLLMTLKNGVPNKAESSKAFLSFNAGSTVWLYNGELPNKTNVRMGYALLLICSILLPLLIILSSMHLFVGADLSASDSRR